MKVFVIFTFAFIASASSVPTSADVILAEFNTFVQTTIPAKVTEVQSKISATVTAKVDPIRTALTDGRTKFVDDLTSQDPALKATADTIGRDFTTWDNFVNAQFSEPILKKEIETQLNSVNAPIIALTKGTQVTSGPQ